MRAARHGQALARAFSPLATPLLCALAISLLTASLASSVYGLPPDDRAPLLSAEFLSGSDPMAEPLPMAAFAPSRDALPPEIKFEGRLTFRAPERTGGFEALRDRFDFMSKALPGLTSPPDFEMDFVQDGDRLIPAQRGLILTRHAAWDLIVQPGRVWREPGDGAFSRAAVPFALQERNANCTHNGVLTFGFNSTGEISRAAYQISSETCFYFQFNMWGAASLTYTPGTVKLTDALVARFRMETAARLPVKPLARIADDHPALSANAFAAPEDVSSKHLTAAGVVVDGVHYRAPCPTRHGPYPFCDELPVPSYSTAKSVFAGLGMMRLKLLYPESFETLIETHVPDCDVAGWNGITFGHALDMATGRYRSRKREADERAAIQDGFFIVSGHAEKIKRACRLYARKDAPGKVWVYHTTDHYVLGTAMQDFLRGRTGPDADIYRDLLVAPIWQRLRLSPLTATTRRTLDDAAQPYTGWGLTLTPDDLARLARFIVVNEGSVDGTALVDSDELGAALQRRPADPGLDAPDKDFRYNNGFWAWDAGKVLNCPASTWIPFMSGYGGITVVLMPNGVIYYYFSDNNEFAWARALKAVHRYRPMCTGQP